MHVRPGLLLGNRGLVRLLLGFAVVNVCEWGFMTAFSVRAFEVGGTFDVGLIGLRLLAGALSAVLIAPRVEDRVGVLTALAAGRAASLALAALLALSGSPFGVVLALVVIDSLFAACYRPTQQRLLPALSRAPSELTQAVAGLSVAKTVGQALGATAGGLLIAIASPRAVMLCAAILMVAAVPCCFRLRRPRAARRTRAGESLLSGLAAFHDVLTDELAWPLVTAGALRTLVRGLWSSLMVVVALHLITAGRSGVGLFQAAAGVGVIFAIPLISTQVGRLRLAVPCMFAFAAAGATVSVIGVEPPLAVALIVICLWGTAMAVSDATSMSLLHRLLDPTALSRTVGTMESLKLVTEGVGALLAPALVAIFGLHVALLVAGAPLLLLVVITFPRVQRADAKAEGRSTLVRLVHGIDLFHYLDMASIEDLASRLVPARARPGEEVISQGGQGDRFYLIDRGEAEVLIDGYAIGRIGPGRGFGERALLRASSRSATVRASTDMELYAIDRADFMSALVGDREGAEMSAVPPTLADPRTLALPDLLGGLTPLHGLDAAAVSALAARCGRGEFVAGEDVITAGEESTEMYVILSGRAEALIDGNAVSVLHPGDVFGEIGVLHRTKRTATVRALDDLAAVIVPGDALLEARRAADGNAA